MSRSKKILIILAIVAGAILLLLLIFKKGKPPEEPVITQTQEEKSLKLVRVIPPEGKNKLLFTGTGILFTFNAPLIPSTANVSIEPTKDIIVEIGRNDPDILVVRPEGVWITGIVYTITVEKGLASEEGGKLEEDIFYTVEFEEVEDIISL